MNYLSVEDIKLIHDEIIEKTGGLKGVLNEHALLMLETQPAQNVFGIEVYPTIHLKAAFYLRTINRDHIFTDGNKRTSMTVVERFLDINNYYFNLTTSELQNYAVAVATNRIEIEEIALWIENHSQKVN